MAAIGPASFRLTSSARNHALLPGCRRIVVGSTEMKFPNASRFTLIWIEFAVTIELGSWSFLRRKISATKRPRYESGRDSVHFSPIKSFKFNFFRFASGWLLLARTASGE